MTELESTIISFVRNMPDQDLIRLVHGHVSKALAAQTEPTIRRFGKSSLTIGQDWFELSLPKVARKAPQKAPKRMPPKALPKGMQAIFATVKSHPGLTSKGISGVAKVPDTTVRDYLKVLCQKRLVTRVPEGRRVTYKKR